MRGSLSSLLGGIGGGRRARSTRSNRSLEALIAELHDTARRYAAPSPFRVGDLVTVRADSDTKGQGEPHVVVEIIDPPVVSDRAEAGSNQFLRKFDLKVAHFAGEHQTIHAIDSVVLEAWSERHAEAWQAKQQQRPEADPARKISADTPFAEVVRRLREERQRRVGGKITWKVGDIVEIVGHEDSNAASPMRFSGRAIGFVETIDSSDDTTRVVYYDEDGDRISQWFKICDLATFRAVEPVSET
jgi:hypothetical protein